ncbi:SH2 domain-containing adapter protein F isoform X2 [Agrilus planipennis]|uniref:SH2 domain-containing adapter protein F isoform X2 n=1 Tax=Agrilus planipennis TaxID=224129 RepID=A0A1W4XPY4_AGRPL|nr:SH2 domain-containing adapter protein F isoform X2 [Agrilus planipennis]
MSRFLGPEFKPKLALNLSDPDKIKSSNLGLPLKPSHFTSTDSLFDVNLPLEKQGWFHGAISRVEAEQVLQDLKEGSFLVRHSGSSRESYSLSLKSTRGFLHVKIRKSGNDDVFTLGNTSNPFKSIPEAIQHFTANRLPIPGAGHMHLMQPVILQLL